MMQHVAQQRYYFYFHLTDISLTVHATNSSFRTVFGANQTYFFLLALYIKRIQPPKLSVTIAVTQVTVWLALTLLFETNVRNF